MIKAATKREPKPKGRGQDVTFAARKDIADILRTGRGPAHPIYRKAIELAALVSAALTVDAHPVSNLQKVSRALEARARVGARKYKTRLKTNNGRNPLVDLFQESLDAIVYTKQGLMERKI
jgi:hypothetical protein